MEGCRSISFPKEMGRAMLNDPSPQPLFEKRLLNNKIRANFLPETLQNRD